MRITGGEGRGRNIISPGKGDFRPTSSMVKEALFNILPSLSGKTFLDICAGTGSVGIEALSRGASLVVFIEKNISLAGSIKKNVLQCSFSGKHEILAMEAKKALLVLQKKKEV